MLARWHLRRDDLRPVIDRRDLVTRAASTMLIPAVLASSAAAQTAPADAPASAFDQGTILALARELVKTPYKPTASDLPEFLSGLSYDQYVAIRAKPSAIIWAGDNAGLAIEPLHRGFVFSAPMQIFLVEDGMARRLAYKASDFDFGAIQPPPNLPDLAFSGFRILARRDGSLAEVGIFQGASFFRARAPGQNLGVQASIRVCLRISSHSRASGQECYDLPCQE